MNTPQLTDDEKKTDVLNRLLAYSATEGLDADHLEKIINLGLSVWSATKSLGLRSA